MKYIKQFLIILTISFIGEILKESLSLPIPASIYGMGILFLCLLTGIVKLESIKETSHFLIDIMPLLFIPAGVGLMNSWGTLREILVPVCLITLVTIITVMAVTGWVSQIIIRRSGEKTDE